MIENGIQTNDGKQMCFLKINEFIFFFQLNFSEKYLLNNRFLFHRTSAADIQSVLEF